MAYQFLLPDEVKKTCYNVTDIKNLIHSRKPNVISELMEDLCENFIVGNKYSYSDAKIKLQKSYDKLTIKIAAKATDLKKYFVLNEGIKIPINGKRVEGFEVLNVKSLV